LAALGSTKFVSAQSLIPNVLFHFLVGQFSFIAALSARIGPQKE
jgi:hypothetical protein